MNRNARLVIELRLEEPRPRLYLAGTTTIDDRLALRAWIESNEGLKELVDLALKVELVERWAA